MKEASYSVLRLVALVSRLTMIVSQLQPSAAGLGRPAAASPQRRPATDAQRRLCPESLDVGFVSFVQISQTNLKTETVEQEQ